MSAYESKPNTAIVYVENGIFNREGVEQVMASNKPIIKVRMNVEGKDLEIPLYFKMVWDDATGGFSDQFFVTSTGSKMLKGKVELPRVKNAVQSVSADDRLRDMGSDYPNDDNNKF